MKPSRAFTVFLKKELHDIFFSPRSYFVAFFFFSVNAFLFLASDYWFSANNASFSFFFLNMPLVTVFVIPLLTMDVVTKDRHLHTDRLLTSFPISLSERVYAHFFAREFFLLVLLLLTMITPLSLLGLGNFSLVVFFVAYVGMFCFCTASLALSLFISTRFNNAPLNFLVSFIVLVFLVVLRIPSDFNMPKSIVSIVHALSFMTHIEVWLNGLFDTRDLIFFLAVTIVALESTVFLMKRLREKHS